MSEAVELTERLYRRHLGAGRVNDLQASGLDVIVGSREGARFEDVRSGRWLWNCHCNGGTYNLGHRPASVLRGLTEALQTLDIGNHHLLSPVRASAARALARLTNDSLPGVVFAASGSEANEVAIRIARLLTGRARIVVTDRCYHGTTAATLATNVGMARRLGMTDCGITSVEWNDVAAMRRAIDDRTALVMLEAIPATAGFPMPNHGYLQSVRKLCDDAGALLLVDEVQTGLGRTGSVWSFQHDAITPDMLVTGKGLSAGLYPIAATLLAPAVYQWYSTQERMHLSTFGGDELGCVVAESVAQTVSDPAFLAHVRTLAALFRDGFDGAPFELRQRGLVMAICVPGQPHWTTWARLREHGVFGMPAAFTKDVVQFKPPLILTEQEAEMIVIAVRKALG